MRNAHALPVPQLPGGLVLLGLAALVGVAPACSDSPGACVGDHCPPSVTSKYTPRFAVDWSQALPTFRGLFQVVDENDRPLSGVKITVGGRTYRTDQNGDLPVEALDATSRILVRVDHPDYMTTFLNASYDSAGVRKHHVTLLKLREAETVDTDGPVSVKAGDAGWQFPPTPFQRADGSRVTGTVQIAMMSVPAEAVDRSAMPGDDVAIAEDGTTTLIREQISLIFTRITDMADRPVQFAPNTVGMLNLRLPSSARERIPMGKRLGLFALDVDRGQWVRESSCEVQAATDGSADRICVGAVTHFSHWLVAEEWDIYDPVNFGCVNMYVDTGDIASLLMPEGDRSPFIAPMPLRRCDTPEDCTLDDTFFYGQKATVAPAGDNPFPSLCGVTQAGLNYRFDATLVRPGGGAFLMSQTFSLDSLSGVSGSETLLDGMLNPSADCPTLCQQVVIKPSVDDLVGGLVDADLDGYFTTTEAADANKLAERDCDDGDAATHPGAPEPLCETVDRNCDDVAPPSSPRYLPGGALASYGECTSRVDEVNGERPLCPYVWNRHCAEGCFDRGDELPGDAYDDDCDGRVIDRDGDGFDLYGQLDPARDCDDDDPTANPDAEEIPGNTVDEDCDGIILDADGDGFFAYGHEIAALAAGLPGDGGDVDLAMMFSDCDDLDPMVNGGVPAEDEAGQLASFFVAGGGATPMRVAHYCDLFDDQGEPTALFRRTVRDLNCDGRVTDVDGDGFSVPGDTSLGDGLDLDCDDYDPRLRAAAGGACNNLDRGGLDNASECTPAAGPDGVVGAGLGCPWLPGTRTNTRTSECVAVAGDQGLCIFPGWDTANPLRLTPGTIWGPCDGPGRLLPDCPTNAACGSPVAYSQDLIDHLGSQFTGGQALEFQGMCFALCEPD